MVVITSVFKILRPCKGCKKEYYPPKLPSRMIVDYCSAECERKAGLRPVRRDVEEEKEKTKLLRREPNSTRLRSTEIPTNFSMSLIHRRLNRKLHQKELALEVGVNYTTIQGWETDAHEVSARNLKRLADFFGVTMDDMWTGKGIL